MNLITQDVFIGAPDWVKSAAVDSNGDAYYYSVPVSGLTLNSDECWWIYRDEEKTAYFVYVNDGYDTTNWKDSAIDRT